MFIKRWDSLCEQARRLSHLFINTPLVPSLSMPIFLKIFISYPSWTTDVRSFRVLRGQQICNAVHVRPREVSRGKQDISFRLLCYLPALILSPRLFYPACSYFRRLKTDGFRLPKIIFGEINAIEETDTSDRRKAKDRGKASRQSLQVYSLQFTLSTFHFSKTISRRYSVTLSFFMYLVLRS